MRTLRPGGLGQHNVIASLDAWWKSKVMMDIVLKCKCANIRTKTTRDSKE